MIVEIDKDMLLRLKHGPIDEQAKMLLRTFFPNGDPARLQDENVWLRG